MEFNEKEIREKYAPKAVSTQIEFEKLMADINDAQRKLVKPFDDKELELLNQRSLLQQQLSGLYMQMDSIDVQKRNLVAKHKEINRVFHDLKHELNLLNPAEKFVNDDKKKFIKITPSADQGTRGNGVYILLDDDTLVPFTRDMPGPDEQPAQMIVIYHDGHSFGIPFDGDLGKSKLLNRDDIPKDDHCLSDFEALLNWDFVGETKHIQELGTPIKLPEGYYLPTSAVWVAIYANRIEINNALRHFGGNPIDFSDDYWFAERSGVGYARLFNGGNGFLNSYYVYYAYRVQAVTLYPNI